jgi:hypothetical protein
MRVNATAPFAQESAPNEDRAIAYLQWRLACTHIKNGRMTPRQWDRLAHAAYQAALYCEDAAAGVYARL